MEITAIEKELQLNVVFFITLSSQEVARKPNKVLPSKSAVKWMPQSLPGYAEMSGYLQRQIELKRIEIIENIQGQTPPLPCLGSFRTIGQQLQCLLCC